MADESLTFLGRSNWRGQGRPFGIHEEDRFAHMYIVGKTGTGKSSLMEAMIRQDLVHGRGVALLDPHGDLAERVVAWVPEARRKDLIYLDVPNPQQPFTFNPLANVPESRRSVTANGIIEALKKIFADSWGIRLEYILRNALLLLLEQPVATIADVLDLFHDEEFRSRAVERVRNPQVARFWRKEFARYSARFRNEAVSPIENKLGNYLADPFVSRILTEAESSFDLRQLMDSSGVLIVNLAKGKIGESPSVLFGSLLVSAISLAGLARADENEEKRRPFFVYLDEFQTFTTLAFANILAEQRKYRLGYVLSSQHLDQIALEVRTAVLGNIGTLLVFRVGASDGAKLAKEVGSPADAEELTFLPNRSFWVRMLAKGVSIPAFTGRTIELRRNAAP